MARLLSSVIADHTTLNLDGCLSYIAPRSLRPSNTSGTIESNFEYCFHSALPSFSLFEDLELSTRPVSAHYPRHCPWLRFPPA